MNDLQYIPITDIEPIKNYRDTEPVSEKDPDVIELSESFLKLGVLQPVLLRPTSGKPGKYELIFGHRRLAACRVAKLEMIPSNIKEVADGDVLEMQVTENLQRKDVHPLDEAIAFESLIRQKRYTPDDIAARFGKNKEFVLHRLKLVDLVPELQKPFKKNLLSAGQAFLICRLRKEDQLAFRKQWKDEAFAGSSVSALQDWINRNLLRQLSSAPFKRDDKELLPAAGPCSTCQKRSGCGNLLFSDLKEDDRCFDPNCFDRKLAAFLARQVRDTIETKPDILFVAQEPGKLPAEIKETLKEMKIQILDPSKYQRYGGYGKMKKRATAFSLDGFQKGRTETIYVEGSEKKQAAAAKGTKPADMSASAIDSTITTISQREKRAKELDIEKVHKVTLEELAKKPELKKTSLKHQGAIDRGIMVFLLITEAAGHEARDAIRTLLPKLPKKPPYNAHAFQKDYIKSLGKLTDDEIALVCRTICLKKWGNPKIISGIGETDTTLRLIAEYSGVDLKTIEADQAEAAERRAERVSNRLKELRDAKKEKSTGKPAGKSSEKAAKKASAEKPKKSGRAKAVKKVRKNHLGQELTDYELDGPPLEEGDVE